MKIFLGADHRGFRLKEQIKNWLIEAGIEFEDLGASDYVPDDDYPDYAFTVCDKVLENQTDFRGVLFCGSGGGMTLAANKVRGIRAAEGNSVDDVIHNRSHNNLNVLIIAADDTNFLSAKNMIQAFMATEFTPESRYQRRIDKITGREHIRG
jgi:ribose 5-phosphate isomerase B